MCRALFHAAYLQPTDGLGSRLIGIRYRRLKTSVDYGVAAGHVPVPHHRPSADNATKKGCSVRARVCGDFMYGYGKDADANERKGREAVDRTAEPNCCIAHG